MDNQDNNQQDGLPQKSEDKTMVVSEAAVKKALQLHFHVKFMWVFAIIGFIVLCGVIVWVKTSSDNKSSRDIASITKQQNGWTLKDKGINARKDTYRHFMINIRRVCGVKYTVGKKRTYGLEDKEVGVWIDINWDFSLVFYFDPYEVPILQIRESSIDPYSPGPSGELPGLAQMMPRTAERIPSIIRKWDKGRLGAFKKLCRKYKVDFNTIMTGDPKEFMLEYKTAIFCQYVLLIWLRDKLDNNRMWYILCYHWGFLLNYYDNGDGELPTYFETQERRYSVAGYWCKFMETLETFREGHLEPSRLIMEQWQEEKRRMIAAERRFVHSVKTVKKVDKAYKSVVLSEKDLKKKNAHLAKVYAKALVDLKALIPQIRNFSGKDIRVILNKYKGPVKDILRQADKQSNFDFYKWWVIFILGGLLSIFLMGTGSWYWSLRIIDSLSHKKLIHWFKNKIKH